jgi:hypothetical protein
MEISNIKRRVSEAIERAKRGAAERRTLADQAAKEYAEFLERAAIPIFRQVANVLRAQGYTFNVFTPAGSVRLMSERAAEDYIELTLETAGGQPAVVGHTSRVRGRRVTASERPLGSGPIRDLTEDDVLEFVLQELEPFVEK